MRGFRVGFIGIVVLLALVISGVVASSHNIPAGNMGAIYDRTIKAGDADALEGFSGVNKTPVSGFVLLNPFTQNISIYPVTMQTVFYSVSTQEGKDSDESIPVRTLEGSLLPADFNLTMSFIPEKIPQVMAKFNGQDFETLRTGFIRAKVREYASAVTAQYTIEELYGSKMGEASKKIDELLKTNLDQYGINVQSCVIQGVHLPADIQARISEKIKAKQDAEKAKADLLRINVENEQKVATAKASAEANLAQQKASADAILYTAQKQAEANLKLSSSLTPQVLAMKRLEVERVKYDKLSPSIQTMIVPDGANMWFGDKLPSVEK